jgi:hypothetical protein
MTLSPNKEIRGGNTLTFSPETVATEKGDIHVFWVDQSSKTWGSDINFKSSRYLREFEIEIIIGF